MTRKLPRPDFNYIAVLRDPPPTYSRVDPNPRPAYTLVRHHPAGCKGHKNRPNLLGWYTAPGTPDELAGRRLCQRCLNMLDAAERRARRAGTKPPVTHRTPGGRTHRQTT